MLGEMQNMIIATEMISSYYYDYTGYIQSILTHYA